MLGLARLIVVVAVVLSPWLFGSADPWYYLPICVIAGTGVACWLIALVSSPGAGLRAPLLTAVLLALLAFVFIQMIPLPISITQRMAPVAAEAQAERARLFKGIDAGEFLPPDLQEPSSVATLSASPDATRRSFYLFAAYIGVFLVMANAFTEWSHIRTAGIVLVVSGFLMAVLGLMQKFSGTRDIFWFHTPRFGGNIFGPFTNRNHFAGQMSMIFGLALGLLGVAARARKREASRPWREKLARLSTPGSARIILLGFVVVLTGATVCVTLSRGAIAALAIALAVIGIAIALRGTTRGRGKILAAVVLLVAGVVAWLGWQPVWKRLGTFARISEDTPATYRITATEDTLRVFRACPVVGCGFGSFQYVFPIFQSSDIQIGRWTHAHNDYAQLFA